MSELFGPAYMHIHVKTKHDIQADRVCKRSDEDILLKEAKKSKTESEIAHLENLADVVNENNGSLKALFEKLDRILGE
jgi:dephospho-CoA kinase